MNIKHIVSCSLGKDSVAMLLMMIEKGIQIDEIVWANTSIEFPENYEYKKRLEKYINRKIKMLRPKTTFDHWFYGNWTKGKRTNEIRGMPFVIIKGGYCCREFKVKPLKTIHDLYKNEKVIDYVGYAYDEQGRTLKDTKYVTYKFPLMEWKVTEQDCKEYLEKRKILNPLYERFNRVGCWLCPKQSINSLKSLWKYYPKLWLKLKKYERDSPHGFRIHETLVQLEDRWIKQETFDSKQLKLIDKNCYQGGD